MRTASFRCITRFPLCRHKPLSLDSPSSIFQRRLRISCVGMASTTLLPTFNNLPTSRVVRKQSSSYGKRGVITMKIKKPLEELYNIRVERQVSKERLAELNVSRWSVWKTGKCQLPWDWHVDQLVYIEEGEVRVVPEGSERYMRFLAGDLIGYPKWFEADLWFNAPYQERYCFKAYGDD